MNCPCEGKGAPKCLPKEIVEKPVLFRLVKIASTIGDETAYPPTVGLYKNVLLNYEVNNHTYIYSSDGIPVLLTGEEAPGATYYAGTGLELNDNTFSVDNTIATKSEIPTTFQTIFYMNASETGGTRHIYKKSDMTDPATSKDVFDANDKGQVILRISTSVTPEMYSDAYLQNAYSATGDYQLLFLDEKTYRSFDTSNLTDSTFVYNSRVLQDKLTAGANVQINGATISATDTTYSDFTGATSSTAGTHGLVPAPATTDVDKYLKSDGTWAAISAGGGVKELTTDDYNYPVNNPEYVAMWLLSPGYYTAPSGVEVRNSTSNGTDSRYADGINFIIGGNSSSNRSAFILSAGGNRAISAVYMSGGYNTYRETRDFAVIRIIDIANSLTSTDEYKVLSAKQGKALNDKIEGRVKTNAGAPTTSTVGTKGQLLEDTTNGDLYICTDATNPYVWEEVGTGGGSTGLITLSYGNSTWQDFLNAYNAGEIVYCRASSAADPSSGDQTRMAFMAYVNNPTTPTEVEFQYVRSVSSKTAAQPCDQVFVYTLTPTNGGTWTVESRNVTYKVAAGTNVTTSYSNGTVTINADAPVITMSSTDPGEGSPLAANNFIAYYE